MIGDALTVAISAIFLVMAFGFGFTTITTKGRGDDWYATGVLLALLSILASWVVAKIGGV